MNGKHTHTLYNYYAHAIFVKQVEHF
jgi:hypothetical protein